MKKTAGRSARWEPCVLVPDIPPNAYASWIPIVRNGFLPCGSWCAKAPEKETSPFETELAAMNSDNLGGLGVLCSYNYSMVSFNSSISAIFMGKVMW